MQSKDYGARDPQHVDQLMPIETSGNSQYFDAVASVVLNSNNSEHFDELHPSVVLDRQLTFLSQSPPSASPLDSTFLFGRKPAWGWDHVFIFPRQSIQQLSNPPDMNPIHQNTGKDNLDQGGGNFHDKPRVEVLARLKSAGFVFSQRLIDAKDKVLVNLSLPENRLKEKAQKIGVELGLQNKWGGGYVSYSKAMEQYFVNWEEQYYRACYFTPAERSKIITTVLESKDDWGCDLNVEQLIYKGDLVEAYSVHSELERSELIDSTVWKRLWDPTYVPPFGKLKDYVGARVALYFVFVSFYARFLLLIALLSVPCYIVYRMLNSTLTISILRWIFSTALITWATLFLETWKRRNALVNIRWGVHKERDHKVRVQFTGKYRYGFYGQGGFVSLEDIATGGQKEKFCSILEAMEQGEEDDVIRDTEPENLPRNLYHNPRESRNARLRSVLVTSLFVVIVGSLNFLMLWWRNDIVEYFRVKTQQEGFSNAVPGIINGILIVIFDSLWRGLSIRLTCKENHRTNQEYENSLVYKRFAFQFVSNYISLFYIAFVKPYLSTNVCIDGYLGTGPDCMVELETQMMSLVLTKATIGQITEVAGPLISCSFAHWRANRQLSAETDLDTNEETKLMRQSEMETHLGVYESTIDDYGEIILQFGYLVLFGVAFPPAAVVALLNNLVEGRVDAYKILVLSKRVNADDAANIGAWYTILEFLNMMAIFANAGLMVFTADGVGKLLGFEGDYSWRGLLYRVVAVFVVEHVFLVIKGLLAYVIKDIPGRVRRWKERENYDIWRWFTSSEEGKESYLGRSLLEWDVRQANFCWKYANMFENGSVSTNTKES